MGDDSEPGGPPRFGRIAAVDVARGLSLVAMAGYHLTWDLAHFGFVPASAPFSPAMRVLSNVIASAFLGLVGVSLALAHPRGLRLAAFARRFAVVAGAALLVTLASYAFDRGEPILFGILHCIALASLVAAPFVGAPAWAAFVVGALAVAAPFALASASFNAPALIWLGLGTEAPRTLDWRPLLPWAGVVLLGLALARATSLRFAASPTARWRPTAAFGRALAFAGRHSLAIYLVHQPALVALVFALAALTGTSAQLEREQYLAACRPACVERGGGEAECASACACVADGARAADISLLPASLEGEARERLRRIVAACSTAAR